MKWVLIILLSTSEPSITQYDTQKACVMVKEQVREMCRDMYGGDCSQTFSAKCIYTDRR